MGGRENGKLARAVQDADTPLFYRGEEMTHSGMWGVGQAPCLPYPPMFSSASSVLASSVLESALGAGKQNSEGFSPVWPAKCPSTSVVRSWGRRRAPGPGNFKRRPRLQGSSAWIVPTARRTPIFLFTTNRAFPPKLRPANPSRSGRWNRPTTFSLRFHPFRGPPPKAFWES